jgi:hypothetical protein
MVRGGYERVAALKRNASHAAMAENRQGHATAVPVRIILFKVPKILRWLANKLRPEELIELGRASRLVGRK